MAKTLKVCDEVEEYRKMAVKDRIVLDGGAHHGHATRVFLQEGAAVVYAVEPHPENCKAWKAQIGDDLCATLIQGALVPPRLVEHGVVLYEGRGSIGSQAHSLIPTNSNQQHITVAGIDFHFLAQGCDCVKLDIEGGEYDLLISPLPERVKAIALEVHVRKPEWRAQEPWLIHFLEDQGFGWIVPPPKSVPKTKWGYSVIGER